MLITKHEYHHILLAQEDRVIASAPVVMEGGEFRGMTGTVKAVGAADVNIANAVMIQTHPSSRASA